MDLRDPNTSYADLWTSCRPMDIAPTYGHSDILWRRRILTELRDPMPPYAGLWTFGILEELSETYGHSRTHRSLRTNGIPMELMPTYGQPRDLWTSCRPMDLLPAHGHFHERPGQIGHQWTSAWTSLVYREISSRVPRCPIYSVTHRNCPRRGRIGSSGVTRWFRRRRPHRPPSPRCGRPRRRSGP